MELNYVKSESTVKPAELEFAKNSVYLRRNISTRTEDDTVLYTYDEACLTPEEFNVYAPQLLVRGQGDTDSNMLSIMEAIVDLYDIITK